MKSRSASEWVKAYDTVHQELTVKGFKPKLQTLDNKARIYSPSMMLLTNWCHLTAIAATPRNAPSGPSKNTLWQGYPQLTPPFHYTCGTDSYRKRKSRCSLSWPLGLQQNSLCSARIQNYCTRETRKATHLGSPRATCIFFGSHNASLLMSKYIHLGHGQ
jgi:hypothetical protein